MLTQKQRRETFCINYFTEGNATEAAIVAGYSPRSARSTASRLLTKGNILARLQELQKKAEDKSVATVLERKQKLTEIIRDDYKAPITAKEKVTATTELNKMERIYDDRSTGETTIVNSFVFILPGGERVSPKKLKEYDDSHS